MKISIALAAIQLLTISVVLVGCSSNVLIQPLNPPTRTWNNTWRQPLDANTNRLTPTSNAPVAAIPITSTMFEMAAPELEFSYPPPLTTLTKQRTAHGVDLGLCTPVSANTVFAPVFTWIRIEINPLLDIDRRCLAQILNTASNQALKIVLAIKLPQFEADSLDSINQLRQFGATLAELLRIHANTVNAVELRANSNASFGSLLNALSLTYGVVKRLNPNIWVIFDERRAISEESWLSTATPSQLAGLLGYVDCMGLHIDNEAIRTLGQRLTAARHTSSNKPICVTVIGPIEQTQIITAWRGVPLLLALPLKTS